MVVNKSILVIILFLIFITSCSNKLSGADVVEILPKEYAESPDVHFCQVEDCNSYLMDLINSSKSSIHCAFFDLDLNNTIKLLIKKSKSVDVKIVIDNENYEEQIRGNGVRIDTSKQYSHNKFCIFDNDAVLTGSFNPTERGNYHNDNNIIIIKAKYLAQNYKDEFSELWNGVFGNGKKVRYPVVYLNNTRIENYFCPEDKCSEKIINVIGKAKESIYFMTFSFTHEKIADAILFKDVLIKGVFETTQAGSKYSQYHRLKDFELDVKKDKNPANMHHKVFIIDKKIVVTGSFNPSKNADRNNDENILIIYDEEIAGKYLREFDRIKNFP